MLSINMHFENSILCIFMKERDGNYAKFGIVFCNNNPKTAEKIHFSQFLAVPFKS